MTIWSRIQEREASFQKNLPEALAIGLNFGEKDVSPVDGSALKRSLLSLTISCAYTFKEKDSKHAKQAAYEQAKGIIAQVIYADVSIATQKLLVALDAHDLKSAREIVRELQSQINC